MPQIEREKLERALIEADKAGDVEAAKALALELKRQTPKAKAPFQRGFEATVEPALTMGTGMIAEPVAGVAGAAALPFVGGQRAGQIVNEVRDAMTYLPRTQPGQQSAGAIGRTLEPVARVITGVENQIGDLGYEAAGPVGGAVAKTIPTAIGLTFGAAPWALKRGVQSIQSKPGTVPSPAASTTPPPAPVSPQSQMTAIVKDLSKQKGEVAAEAVRPDKDVMAAADRLKINLSPSHYSTNPTYIELEQALKSRPGSNIKAVEVEAIKRIGEEAERVIRDMGGSPDRTVFSGQLSSQINTTIRSLESQSDALYKKVSDAIPGKTSVDAPASRSYIQNILDELGGDVKLLSGPEKELLGLLAEDKNLTYTALDRLRRDVGRGFQRQGPYADSDSAILDKVYGALSDDQLAVARDFGADSSFVAAKKLVQTRKQLEEKSVALFGRDLEGSAAPKIRQAATDLIKGNPSTLTRFLQNVPDNLRKDAAVAVLNDVFTAGSRTGAEVGQGFATAFRGLKTNRGAMDTLLRELPEGARQRFDDLGKVADALYRAKAQENVSKTARDVLAALDSPNTIARIYDVGRKVAAAEGVTSSAGVPGAGTAGVLASTLTRPKTAASEAADAFISSPQFKAAIEMIASGNVKSAEKMAMSGKAFKEWITTVPPKSQQAIATVGFIGWLTGQDE